jgi:hypothetical protein
MLLSWCLVMWCACTLGTGYLQVGAGGSEAGSVAERQVLSQMHDAPHDVKGARVGFSTDLRP